MAHALKHIRTKQRQQSSWPILVLLLVAVSVSGACVLWFMTQAIGNERLASRQKIVSVYEDQLNVAKRRIAAYWIDRAAQLAFPNEPISSAAHFARLIRDDLADGVVIFDSSGRVEYPSPAQQTPGNNATQSVPWQNAERLEHEQLDYIAASRAYEAIAVAAVTQSEAAQALQAQARCLAKLQQREVALNILTGTLSEPQYRESLDRNGNLILPNALLFALRLMSDEDVDARSTTLSELQEIVNDYANTVMPSSQRLFIMQQLESLGVDRESLGTLDAEARSATYLQNNPPPPPPDIGVLQRTRRADQWRLASSDGRVLALLREQRVLSETRTLTNDEFALSEATITLLPPGADPAQPPEPLLVKAMEEPLIGWSVALQLTGDDPFVSAADKRISAYLWTGAIVVGTIALLTVVIGRFVSAQTRLARIRNDLVATVTHELKTPLASMRALVDTMLQGRCRDQEQQNEYLELISTENERLTRVIDNFLAFSRMERNKHAFEFREVHIDSIIDAAADAMRERFASLEGQLHREIEPNLPAVTADADALTTVLINLLDNAHKYTGDDKHIVCRAYCDNGMVCLEVQDNGIGLSRRAVKRVFDRFYQVDQSLSRSRAGCGLGLSIVQFIVKAHGGTIGVTSELGKGTIFSVRLPASGTNPANQG